MWIIRSSFCLYKNISSCSFKDTPLLLSLTERQSGNYSSHSLALCGQRTWGGPQRAWQTIPTDSPFTKRQFLLCHLMSPPVLSLRSFIHSVFPGVRKKDSWSYLQGAESTPSIPFWIGRLIVLTKWSHSVSVKMTPFDWACLQHRCWFDFDLKVWKSLQKCFFFLPSLFPLNNVLSDPAGLYFGHQFFFLLIYLSIFLRNCVVFWPWTSLNTVIAKSLGRCCYGE